MNKDLIKKRLLDLLAKSDSSGKSLRIFGKVKEELALFLFSKLWGDPDFWSEEFDKFEILLEADCQELWFIVFNCFIEAAIKQEFLLHYRLITPPPIRPRSAKFYAVEI